MSEIIATGRSIHTITAEIVGIATSTAQVLFMSAIEMGKRMTEVKELSAHGEWGEQLKVICQQIDISESTAHNWMRLAREYGDKTNFQALGNLSYTKAVKLLSLPEAEREEFTQQHDVEKMSSRELEQAIKERDAAREMLAAAQDTATASQQKAADLQKENARLNASAKRAEDLQKEVDRLNAAVNKATAAEEKAKASLKKLKENPKVPAETIEKLASDAADQAQKDFSEKLAAAQKEADAANQAKAAAEQALRDAEAKLDEARKKTKLADPDVAAFGVVFAQFQSQYNQLQGYLLKITGSNPEQGAKFKTLIGKQLEMWQAKAG